MITIIWVLVGIIATTVLLNKVNQVQSGSDSAAFMTGMIALGVEFVFLGTAMGMQGMIESNFLLGLLFIPLGLICVWAFGGED